MQQAPDQPWWKKLGWLILLWAASVSTLGLVAYGIRLFMKTAGLTT